MTALLVITVSLTGCVHVRNNLHNMLADSMDIFRADLSASFGTDMGAHLMATQYAQLKSYSYENIYRIGFGKRHVGVWKEDREDWWVGTEHAPNMHIRSESVKVMAAILPARVVARAGTPLGLMGESPDEFGIGAHLFVLGFRIGVRPLEFADFLVSPFGLDPCDDNMSWAERQSLRHPKESASRTRWRE